MIPSPKNTAVLDACVLYPAPIRDLLLHFAEAELFKPFWSNIIQNEWMTNLLENRKDLNEEQLIKTVNAMNAAFPDANTEGFEPLINSISLPDPKDRHVLAAAITKKADSIITLNLKDFPSGYLKKYNIDALHPDQFILNVIALNENKAIEAFELLISRLKRPPMSKENVLISLQKCGLIETARFFNMKITST